MAMSRTSGGTIEIKYLLLGGGLLGAIVLALHRSGVGGSIVRLSKNFLLSEFQKIYRLGGVKQGHVPASLMPNLRVLVADLQKIRDRVGRSVTIVSGYRDLYKNTLAEGAPKSRHLFADAADFRVSGMTATQVKEVVEDMIRRGEIRNGGVGLYTRANGWIHYDHGPARRWVEV